MFLFYAESLSSLPTLVRCRATEIDARFYPIDCCTEFIQRDTQWIKRARQPKKTPNTRGRMQ